MTFALFSPLPLLTTSKKENIRKYCHNLYAKMTMTIQKFSTAIEDYMNDKYNDRENVSIK